MDEKKIIQLLNADLQDEHGAIIQYLSHAYAIGEGEMSCEIEATAREEMRHLDWLAETIVELGGEPSLKRGTMKMGGKTVPEWMQNNVALEEGAISKYQEHIKLIDNPKIKRLLKRILADEQAHHADFVHFVEKSAREKAADHRGDRKDDVTKMLNWGIEHEYTVILQYLFHSYMSENTEAKKQLESRPSTRCSTSAGWPRNWSTAAAIRNWSIPRPTSRLRPRKCSRLTSRLRRKWPKPMTTLPRKLKTPA